MSPCRAGRDLWWSDLTDRLLARCAPVWVNAEHPLFLLYTSGSTGKPKGIQHASAGYLLEREAQQRVGVRSAR